VKQPVAQPEKADEPRAPHQLTSVMMSGSGSVAVIDGNTLAVGDVGGGGRFPSEFKVKNTDGSTSIVKLISATKSENGGTATIDVDGRRVELRIESRLKADVKVSDSSSSN
jgi:hypothetical protein